jgi:hypothetical protein
MTDVTPFIEKVGQEIADFSIGFLNLSVHDREEQAEPAGSGALVTVGSVHGILTAAHVLRKLPANGKVGIVRFTRSPTVQKQTIDMTLNEKLLIGEDYPDDDIPRSPDIGFLRLAPDQVATLNATNIFFNLSKREESVLGNEHPGQEYFEGVSGVVAEWTIDHQVGEAGFDRLKGFRGLFGVGLVSGTRECSGYDLVDFQVTYDDNTKAPFSYGGVSGAALWRVYLKEDNDGQQSVSDKRIFGVAFHQSKLIDGVRTISCHGPKSVYDVLIQQIQKNGPRHNPLRVTGGAFLANQSNHAAIVSQCCVWSLKLARQRQRERSR